MGKVCGQHQGADRQGRRVEENLPFCPSHHSANCCFGTTRLGAIRIWVDYFGCCCLIFPNLFYYKNLLRHKKTEKIFYCKHPYSHHLHSAVNVEHICFITICPSILPSAHPSVYPFLVTDFKVSCRHLHPSC